MSHKTETEKLVEYCMRAAERGDVQQMLTSADELLRRDPSNVDAMYVAGTALMHGEQQGLAALLLNAARCACKDEQKLGAIWNNLGWALQNYQPEEAYRCFKESLKYGEAPPGTYDNLCCTASQIGRHAEALEWSNKAGVGWDTSHNRAFALLHLGRWEEAWKCYKTSAGTPSRPRTERSYDLPRWKGQKGKLIIHGEQGVGDEIMFMSMVPADFDGVIECSPRMEGLFARSFPKAAVYGTLLNNFIEWPFKEKADYHIEMGGLGEYFAAQPFGRGGWLAADEARCAAWRAWLESYCNGNELCADASDSMVLQSDILRIRRSENGSLERRPRPQQLVGLSWTGGTWATGRRERTIPFPLVERLIKQHPDVTFVCLEYEDRKDELADYPQVLNPHWATKKGADMDDLAALCASLDLIITATNSTVDVAGALGVPTWAMVPHNPPWRYSDAAAPAGDNSMWFYESVRTFRQRGDDCGDWDRVMKHVSVALEQLKMAKAA